MKTANDIIVNEELNTEVDLDYMDLIFDELIRQHEECECPEENRYSDIEMRVQELKGMFGTLLHELAEYQLKAEKEQA